MLRYIQLDSVSARLRNLTIHGYIVTDQLYIVVVLLASTLGKKWSPKF